jgi:hypothetical protein
MQENNMNEIIRFNKEKRHGLVEMLKGFVRNQVESLKFNCNVILLSAVVDPFNLLMISK